MLCHLLLQLGTSLASLSLHGAGLTHPLVDSLEKVVSRAPISIVHKLPAIVVGPELFQAAEAMLFRIIQAASIQGHLHKIQNGA